MVLNAETIIRILTITSLSGLLFTTGLRLTWPEISASLRRNRIGWILPVNFLLVPVLTFIVARWLHFPNDLAIGMMLLGTAPFAPVVPVFTKMSRGDMPLAGALTALFPFFAAFLTPVICDFALKPWLGTGALKFSFFRILLVLVSTITFPLAAGVTFTHWFPKLGRTLIKPFDVFSEGAGAISLGFVSYVNFSVVRQTDWHVLLAMAVVFELSLLAGYALSGPGPAARRVVALGTSNRNIALALLVGIESFPGTSVLAAVVANGLLLIFLGLLHVAYWRFLKPLPANTAENGREKAQETQR